MEKGLKTKQGEFKWRILKSGFNFTRFVTH